ncbi:hypothetical protein Agub_g6502 [Astrephomene gubernaculifera]|uniref:Uncharacterized protein n=1 Tax=Astrephomene gubernaculifera TaxID=47775 RepID=A0AAD3DQK1_9CHLO|nr:hypothetical protein Agub_g6502 [Astrephomene gubernaculifera]
MTSLAVCPSRQGLILGRKCLGVAALRQPCIGQMRQRRVHAPFPCVADQVNASTQAQDDVDGIEVEMHAARESVAGNGTMPSALLAEAEDLKTKFELIQEEIATYKQLSVDNEKLEEEVARLRQEREELLSQLAAQEAAGQLAVAAARQEGDAALQLQQQQLEELSLQLQNSQVQLERLGEAVEAAEADKVATVEALQAENRQLLLALANAAKRVADILYPAGSLPGSLSVSTRLEGNAVEVVREVLAAQQQQQEEAAAAAAGGPMGHSAAAIHSRGREQWCACSSPLGRFVGWLAGAVGFWLYHAVGALVLYYASAIWRGRPATLNLEFGVGCVAVCTLLSWTSRLLLPRLGA